MTKKDVQEVHRQWRQEIIRRITETQDSYQAIAVDSGCSIGTVQGIARAAGVRRKADARNVEVSNG